MILLRASIQSIQVGVAGLFIAHAEKLPLWRTTQLVAIEGAVASILCAVSDACYNVPVANRLFAHWSAINLMNFFTSGEFKRVERPLILALITMEIANYVLADLRKGNEGRLNRIFSSWGQATQGSRQQAGLSGSYPSFTPFQSFAGLQTDPPGGYHRSGASFRSSFTSSPTPSSLPFSPTRGSTLGSNGLGGTSFLSEFKLPPFGYKPGYNLGQEWASVSFSPFSSSNPPRPSPPYGNFSSHFSSQPYGGSGLSSFSMQQSWNRRSGYR